MRYRVAASQCLSVELPAAADRALARRPLSGTLGADRAHGARTEVFTDVPGPYPLSCQTACFSTNPVGLPRKLGDSGMSRRARWLAGESGGGFMKDDRDDWSRWELLKGTAAIATAGWLGLHAEDSAAQPSH